ncbi:sigma-70 family RNA polymerase sigma factor [Micromonospora sp. NBC_01796]|uniref:sigma-70 family RNA polymerase sigma factor n=1 Tax=Micromonospora sp. NBC_01796 TaxID=2975987 RepID=UPI002DD7C272|nr:sigma-70 family RNA polymerase sigma factor [Micromonospora sp. NBC_01796]WSA86517.1 sigma-70 family RNA polymerase sigma factor [Micromonospora sp. NBC_01796]
MPATGSDDDEITRWALAAKAGDRTAAGAFIRATQHDVHRFVTHLIGHADAEDLTQETYLRAMRALPRFAARSSARTWLLAIARRVAADHIRALVRRPRTAELADWQGAADAARAGHGSGFEEEVVLDQLLRTLPRDRREAFVATQVAGLSYAEAAEVCDCPVGTIRSRVARARADLVAAMRAQGGPDDHVRVTG